MSISHIALLGLFAFLSQAPVTIQGVITKAATGEGLSKAIVELQSIDAANANNSYSATTSADGKFAFPNVPPGRYRLVANRAGYVRKEYRPIVEAGPDRPNTTIRLGMVQTGTIYGRIVDRAGQPLTNATVRALKTTYPDGKRTLSIEQ